MSVDNIVSGHWLGSVIPKRNARAAVTRNLLRRQIRAVISRHEANLAPGLWLVRLRAPYSRTSFHAASSEHLRDAAAQELDALFARAVR